uniref:FAR1 domain-containing protein n=1 Tax=Hordeum vulgare subsp. vulgare TaxID=112509 RepID=A0A8I6XXQ7_HORVV
MIDLNEEPDENNGDPVYCTQHAAGNTEFVAEPPNPPIIQKVSVAAAEGIVTDGHSSHGMAAPGNTQVPAAVATESDVHTLDGTCAASDTGGTIANGFGGENDDESWSHPKEPHVGMRFDTLEGTKHHYNFYSLQIGFSIKMNTSRKAAKTGKLIKQQFVCNKFRKPKVDDGGAEKIHVLDEIVDETKDDDEDEDIVFLDDDSKTKKTTKKWKRDTILQTGCRPKMVVKLIDGRWEVIQFVGEHNHPLADKPSLTKYLR